MNNGPHDLASLIKRQARRMTQSDKHSVFGHVGEPGTAKTSLAMLLMRKLAEELGTDYSPTKNMVFGEQRAVRLGKRIGARQIIHADESGEGGHKVRFMSGANVDVADHLDRCRKLNQHYSFTRPFFEDWPLAVQRHLQWVLMHKERGHVSVYEVTLVGFKRKIPVLVHRFDDQFPDPQEVAPELWAEYQEFLDRALYDEDPEATDLFQEEVRRMQAAIRSTLPVGWAPPGK